MSDADIPPRLYRLVRYAIGLSVAALGLAGSVAALCLQHHAIP